MKTITWRCSRCDACTVTPENPRLCPNCQRATMVLWNITEDVPPTPLIQVGRPDWPVSRWLEDRMEKNCLICNRPLKKFLPQGFVGLVIKNDGHTFPIGAACEPCAWEHSEGQAVQLAPVETVGLRPARSPEEMS